MSVLIGLANSLREFADMPETLVIIIYIWVMSIILSLIN